jgi:hypothetical protein
MAVENSAKKTRDALLDELKQANDEYYKKELKRIEAEESYLKDVLKARSAASSLAKANASASKLLLINDISTFLAG